MGGSGVIQRQHVLANVDDLRQQLGESATRCYQQFDQQAKDWMSPWEYYLNEHPQAYRGTPADQSFGPVIEQIADAKVRRYMHDLIHSDLATEPNDTTIAYGMQNYLMNDARYMQLYSIVGGNEQLVQELARRISARVLLEHPVYSIQRQADGRLAITTQQGHTQQTEAFDYVVIALRIIICQNCIADAKFKANNPKSPRTFQLSGPLFASDAAVRDSVLAESIERFLLDARSARRLLFCTTNPRVWPNHANGILGWLLGGKDALELSSLNDAELIERALMSLPELCQRREIN